MYNPGGAITGTLIGFLLVPYGMLYLKQVDMMICYILMNLYNNVVCNRPSKQSFKCSVYRVVNY